MDLTAAALFVATRARSRRRRLHLLLGEGSPDDVLAALDATPYADAPSRASFTKDEVAADLDRLASQQQLDGGWTVTFPSYGPAAALGWRSYATVQAVAVLRDTAM